jgi:hypothetical protein
MDDFRMAITCLNCGTISLSFRIEYQLLESNLHKTYSYLPVDVIDSFIINIMQHIFRSTRLQVSPLCRQYTWAGSVPMTKIVATIGPASEQLDMLKQVTAAGMRIMRINFSHATYEEADLRTKNLRLVRLSFIL